MHTQILLHTWKEGPERTFPTIDRKRQFTYASYCVPLKRRRMDVLARERTFLSDVPVSQMKDHAVTKRFCPDGDARAVGWALLLHTDSI